MSSVFNKFNLILLSILVRIGFFLFGLYQDAMMDVKYTDIDYLVFTDAAKYVYNGGSPYDRETYRYTPLLAWLLIPNITHWYSFGKFLFIVSDIITGVIILQILQLNKVSTPRQLILGSIWLLNPMVITISTRGSSESVLTVFIMSFVYFLLKEQVVLSGVFIGLAVHFKIYPIIYIPTALLYLLDSSISLRNFHKVLKNGKVIKFAISSFLSFTLLSTIMYSIYGDEFINHSYLYHLSRIDHRHNFSIYNLSLYFKSALSSDNQSIGLNFTKLAFLPQLIISTILIPLALTRLNLTSTLFLQTFTFVTFNKVITSQYFIWYLIFLPLFLQKSTLLTTNKVKGIIGLALWIITQGLWLLYAYKLEFLGENTFFPGIFTGAVLFFLSNVYLSGLFIDDIIASET